VVSELPPLINIVEIEATTTQTSSSQTVIKTSLNLAAHGMAYNFS